MATGKPRAAWPEPGDNATAAELEAAAGEAEEAAGALEDRALESGEAGIDLRDIGSLRQLAERLTFRARVARKQEEHAAEARRLDGLRQLRSDAERYASQAEARAEMNASLELICDAARAFRSAAAAHDETLQGFRDRAIDLGAQGPAPGGPPARHGRIALAGNRLLAGAVQLNPARAGHLDELLTAAVSGEHARLPADALVITTHRRRPVHVLFAPRPGAFHERDSIDDEPYLYARDHGELVPLTPAEIDAYLSGEVIDLAVLQQRARDQIAAAAAADRARRETLVRDGIEA